MVGFSGISGGFGRGRFVEGEDRRQDPAKRKNRDEPQRSGLQHETHDPDAGRPNADPGNPGLIASARFVAITP
jgi:hypothetical protein